MPHIRTPLLLLTAGIMLFGAISTGRADEPRFSADFWNYWGDGKAELAGYQIIYPRYGAPRKGSAVMIFVTEPFSHTARVKADPGNHPEEDVYQVLKLNFVQDFPTGIYDYNLMTSVFAALQPIGIRKAGSLSKVSFSSQEWCGHVYSQVLFDEKSIRHTAHSYFDGEADTDETLSVPVGLLSEDGIFHWARGFSPPLLQPGEQKTVAFLRSLTHSRLLHKPLTQTTAVVGRNDAPSSVSVPAGRFDVEQYTVEIENGPRWTISVEQQKPRRIIAWQTSDGYTGELLASDRLPYWQLNGPGYLKAVEKLGLSPRPERTP